jgi:hypothetical protein
MLIHGQRLRSADGPACDILTAPTLDIEKVQEKK